MLFYLNGFVFWYIRKNGQHPFPHVYRCISHRGIYNKQQITKNEKEEEENTKMSIEKIISSRNQLIKENCQIEEKLAEFFTFSYSFFFVSSERENE